MICKNVFIFNFAAENNGITIEGPTGLIDYLKAMDVHLLVNIALPAVGATSYPGLAWSPVIEGKEHFAMIFVPTLS